MTTKLSFVDQIKAALRAFNTRKPFTLKQADNHEIEFLPSPTPVRRIAHAINPKKQAGAWLVARESNRFWSANLKNLDDCAQTPSNLG